MKTIHIFAIITVAFALGCNRPAASPKETGSAVRVQAVSVQLQQVVDTYDAAGTVRAKTSATVAAKIMAAVREVSVRAGDAVTAGQILAQLDDRDSRAEFDRAKADFQRFRALLEKEAATRAEFEAVQARYRVAEAALSYATITAPFAGVVTGKMCEPGDMAAPGQPLFVVEETTAYRLEAQVPDRLAAQVAVGQSWPVTLDATGETCAGTVAEVIPAADPASRSVTVKIDLACRQPVKSGLFGRAAVPVGQRPALLVPASAVRERGQLTYVFVAHDGRAQMRLVKTGEKQGDAVEILSGLQPEERVIVAGDVADGQPVSQ